MCCLCFTDKRLALKHRTLVLGPLDVEDLDNEIIRQLAVEAESFQYKTSKTKDGKNRGSVFSHLHKQMTMTCFRFLVTTKGISRRRGLVLTCLVLQSDLRVCEGQGDVRGVCEESLWFQGKRAC